MPLKITYKKIGWTNNSLRGYSRPKMGHVLSRIAAEYKDPLARRAQTRKVIELMLIFVGIVVLLLIADLSNMNLE